MHALWVQPKSLRNKLWQEVLDYTLQIYRAQFVAKRKSNIIIGAFTITQIKELEKVKSVNVSAR